MPRGFQGVRQASADVETRRSASGAPSALWFRIADGEEAIVRFLEQGDDIFWCYVHDVPVPNRQFGRDVVCCNQAQDGTRCPGCERDLSRKFKGFINVIWNSAPVFKRDGDGKLIKEDGKVVVIGEKPQVAVWGSGIRVFEDLDEIDMNYRGLRSRPFVVKRKGVKLSTKYSISPADVDAGPIDFTAEEKKLEANKYNLAEMTKPPTYDAFLKELGELPQDNQNGNGGNNMREKNPFMRNRPGS